MDQPGPVAPDPAHPMPWWKSLRTRLMLLSTLTSVLLLAGVALIFYAALRTVLVENAKTELRGLTSQSARALQATLESVQVSGQALAGSAASIGREPANLGNLMKATLAADPAIAGVMLIIEPGRITPDDPGFDWYIRRDGERLVESSVRALGPEYADYRPLPWWVRTMTSPGPWWSEPYRNEATANEWFVTYNLALRRPGDPPTAEPVGMVSVDVPVRRLRAVLGEAPAHPQMRPVLISPEGRLVLHPDPAVAMVETARSLVEDHGRSDLAPVRDALARRDGLELRHAVAGPGPDAGQVRYTFLAPVGASGWAFALSVDEAWILAELGRVTLWGLGGGLLGVGLCVVVVRHFSGRIARPIEDLTDSARHFEQGEFDYPLGHTDGDDEVGVMARAFDAARGSIKRQMTEIAEMGAARARLEGELTIARDIQEALLPAPGTLQRDGRRLEWDGVLDPAKAVGGDFYNVFDREGEALWFVVGDVSDKGIPSALFMARAMTVLEVAAMAGGSPAKALHEAALHLIEGNDTCMFATVACGVIQLRTGELALASAGHEAPLLLHADGRRDYLPVPTTAPLGVDVADDYPVWRGRLVPGDTLLLYSDGVTEAFDVHDHPFGNERLADALDPARSPRAQCDALLAAVRAFAGDAPQSDDITILALRYDADGAAP